MVDRGEAFGPLTVGGVLGLDRCDAGCWIAFPRGCGGCGLGGLKSELLRGRRGVIFEEAASAGAGTAVCCSSGAARGGGLASMNECVCAKHATGFGICNNLSSSTAHRTTLQVSLQVFLEPLAVPQGGVSSLQVRFWMWPRFHGRAS